MPLEQTITIVNNSGKIIGTGKQLLSVFKEAKGAYQEKKAQLKSERSTLNRAQTFDHHPTRSLYRHHDPHDYAEYYEEDDDYYHQYHDDHSRHRRHDVAPSEASSRRTARRSRSVVSKHRHRDRDNGSVAGSRAQAPLTESNLKTHSEVSSTAPSRAARDNHYRSPYVETARDMTVSKFDLAHADMRSLAISERRPPPTIMTRRQSMQEFDRSRRSSYDSQAHSSRRNSHAKDIDMHLAYGDIPPDLEHRVDLDSEHEDADPESKAKAIIRKVEFMLDEADCLKHSATSTITHLQQNPDAAAAVALSLAELSKLVTQMSPAFIGFIKGGSPAVFALLASPHFLIGSAAVVGVTVVMFGGWKIVKKVKEAQVAREALAYEGVPLDRPAPMRTQSEFSTGMDEALILDDELSSIDTWRRGILPEFGEVESADMELITPEADRAIRKEKDADYDDLRSRRSARTTKTSKTSKTAKSKRTQEREIPERKSSRQPTAESVAGTERSKKTSSKKKDKAPLRAIEDGRSRRGEDEFDLGLRPKTQRQSNMLKALFKNKKEKELVHV